MCVARRTHSSQPTHWHNGHTDTSTPLPGSGPSTIVSVLSIACLRPRPSYPQTSGPTLASFDRITRLFFSFFHSKRTNTQSYKETTTEPTHRPPTFTSSRLSIKPPYSATLSIRRPPGPPLASFSHRTAKAALVSTLSTRSTTLVQFQPLNCILPTSFQAVQADGRKTLSILEYLADTRARAHPRRKESRHRPGTILPRHFLQPAYPPYPAGRLA